MKEKSLVKEFLEATIILVTIILLATIIAVVCTANIRGKVTKYASYAGKVVVNEQYDQLKENDYIITKKVDNYNLKDTIWYFKSPTETAFAKIQGIVTDTDEPAYIVDTTDEPVYLVNVIGRVEYRIPEIGKYIKILKEVPLCTYIVALITICFFTRFLEIGDKENN